MINKFHWYKIKYEGVESYEIKKQTIGDMLDDAYDFYRWYFFDKEWKHLKNSCKTNKGEVMKIW